MSGDTIESLIRERRKTEKESKLLQAQIDRLEAEKLEKDDEGTLEALSSQIEKLSFEKREKAKKTKRHMPDRQNDQCRRLISTKTE